MNIKSIINRLLLRDANMLPNISYGQEGEDLILNRLFDGKKKGFYVDVGAHHPARFSNTFLFYKRGWRGINIDALPGSMDKFNKIRPKDINVECGVARASGRLIYHRFNEPALNTFSVEEAAIKNSPPYHLVDTVLVSVEPLSSLLNRYLPSGQDIDFLTVDVEGFDEEVLRSNDWKIYRPRIVLAETLRTNLLNIDKCLITQFMRSVGYSLAAKTYNTSFFLRD